MSTLNGEQAKAALIEIHRMSVAALERTPAEDFTGVAEQVERRIGISLEDMVLLFKLRPIEIDVDSFVAGMFGGADAVRPLLQAASHRPREDA